MTRRHGDKRTRRRRFPKLPLSPGPLVEICYHPCMAKAVPELKPYAVTARNSRGRVYKESFLPNVDPFAIDRQRVLHSAAGTSPFRL
jgi:hypothetical protein